MQTKKIKNIEVPFFELNIFPRVTLKKFSSKKLKNHSLTFFSLIANKIIYKLSKIYKTYKYSSFKTSNRDAFLKFTIPLFFLCFVQHLADFSFSVLRYYHIYYSQVHFSL